MYVELYPACMRDTHGIDNIHIGTVLIQDNIIVHGEYLPFYHNFQSDHGAAYPYCDVIKYLSMDVGM